MTADLKNMKFTFTLASLLILLIIISMPLVSSGSELFHTIQTASFTSEIAAQQHYEHVKRKLNEDERQYLRIEKIGGHYAVRFGKFKSFAETKKILRSARQKFAALLVVKAYIKDERILRMYASTPVEGHSADMDIVKEVQ